MAANRDSYFAHLNVASVTLKVLVVGYGSVGQRHLRIIRGSMPYAKIMVLRHEQVTSGVEHADITTSSFDDVRAFKPELAVLANPASFHADVALKLLNLNCHLLIEKPLAVTVEQGLAILRVAQAKGRICRVGYNLRHLPSLRVFREQLQKKHIGRVLSIRCEAGQFLGSWRPGTDYRKGVSARRELGGGVLLELSHELDYLSWIFGGIQWVRAWLGQQSSLEIDVEDTAHLVLGFKSSHGSSPVATLNLDFVRRDASRRCVVIAERGSLLWDAGSGTVEMWLDCDNDWSTLYKSAPNRDFSYEVQWETFLRSVDGGCGLGYAPGASLQEALDVLRLIEAARVSSLKGGLQVNLPSRENNAH